MMWIQGDTLAIIQLQNGRDFKKKCVSVEEINLFALVSKICTRQ
jgi:hypothetical protein